MDDDEPTQNNGQSLVPPWLVAARAELDTSSTTAPTASSKNIDDDRADKSPPCSSPSSKKIATVDIHNNNSSSSSSSSSSSDTNTSLRQQVGNSLAVFSELINNNLIVVRYATVSTVLLLGAYGIANTPLFHRYKRIMDIPSQKFVKRKWIHGRIVGVVVETNERSWLASSAIGQPSSPWEQTTQQHPIVLLFRHSSPIERFLFHPSTWGMKFPNPLSTTNHPTRNLLRIELAGISRPPTSQSKSILSTSLVGNAPTGSQCPLLDQLIQLESRVSLQLLAQRVSSSSNMKFTRKASVDSTDKGSPMDVDDQSMAICHLHYQETNQWFTTTNLSLQLVRLGQAWMNDGSGGLVLPSSDNTVNRTNNNGSDTTIDSSLVIDYDSTVPQLQHDAKFVSQLEEGEYTAWKTKVGMWSSEDIRQLRSEYVEEEERLKNEWRLWTLIERGWEWIRK